MVSTPSVPDGRSSQADGSVVDGEVMNGLVGTSSVRLGGNGVAPGDPGLQQHPEREQAERQQTRDVPVKDDSRLQSRRRNAVRRLLELDKISQTHRRTGMRWVHARAVSTVM